MAYFITNMPYSLQDMAFLITNMSNLMNDMPKL